MTLEELFNLPVGEYKASLTDVQHYTYTMKVYRDKNFTVGHTYKNWIEIRLENPDNRHDTLYISRSQNDYILFSAEPVSGLSISTTNTPAWLEYLTLN